MTAIAALIENGRAYVGGDAAASTSSALTCREASKVFRNGDFLFGCAGSFRQMQVLRYIFEPPKVPKGCANLERFMVRDFIRALELCLRTNGVAGSDSNGSHHSDKESKMVVAFRDHLFTIEYDYQIGINLEPIASAGIGGYEAQAALAALIDSSHLTPEDKITRALQISERYNPSVRAPFTILKTSRR